MIYRGPDILAIFMIWLLPPPPSPLSRQQIVSLSQSSYVSPAVELTDGKGGGGREGKDQIIRRGEILVLYKLFNTIWYFISLHQHLQIGKTGQYQFKKCVFVSEVKS
jgi:hypothetical protein